MFKAIHFKAIVFVVIYSIISYLILISSLSHQNIFITFLIPLVFGILSSIAFLYLFNHQDFFKFIKNLEKTQSKTSKKYIDKFLHYGKILACILTSLIGGPILLALTVRFLFPKSKNKYKIAIICSIISTLIFVTFTKGLWEMIF